MPRLRVLAGPSLDSLRPICANTNKAHTINSEFFEGRVVVHIKGFPDSDGNVLESEYFEREDRKGVTWSIQVQGRFLQPHSADDILFGNTFDRPLKLPWGSSAALKFMNLIDPTLEHDLSGPQPWALSPLVSTMPHLSHNSRVGAAASSSPPAFPAKQSIGDDISNLNVLSSSSSGESSSGSSPSSSADSVSSGGSGKKDKKSKSKKTNGSLNGNTAKTRRSYFSQVDNRRAVQFGPDDIITTDFCYGFLTFPALALCLPGGISFDLNKYWDGQPVRFVCCERPPNGTSVNETKVFWCVAIEKVGDE